MAKTVFNQLNRMRAKPGREAEVREILEALVAYTHSEENPVAYDLFQAKDDSTKFIIYEAWASNDAVQQHLKSAYFQGVIAKMGDLVAERSADGKPFEGEQLTMLTDNA